MERRPAEELYAVNEDPGCLDNLVTEERHRETLTKLRDQLFDYLKETGDARVLGNGDIWETYPRVSSLRWFPKPEWAVKQTNNVAKRDWLEVRRP